MPLLAQVAERQHCLVESFFDTTPDELRSTITADNELEDKTTLAFFVNGESVDDTRFVEHYNEQNPDKPITYAGKLFENALAAKGILSYGEGQNEPYTKNLVSYCYDRSDKSLSDQRITLRIRHEEYKDTSGNWHMKAPDISTKFQLDPNSTESRAEFEKGHDFVHEGDGKPKFLLSLLPIIEEQVAKRHKNDGALAAMNWLKKFTDLVGFDFTDKREKSNINCRRTQPFAVTYTRYDHEGQLLRDDSGKPKLFNNTDISKEDHLRGIRPANQIVFMLCLDVNRVFDPRRPGVKIARDNEWEHEHQDHMCSYTPGAIKSSDGVTREEIDAMDNYLKSVKAEVMQDNGIKKSPLSGMNKDARAYFYITRSEGKNAPLPDELTLRGKMDNIIVDRIPDFEALLKRSNIVRAAYQDALAQKQYPKAKVA